MELFNYQQGIDRERAPTHAHVLHTACLLSDHLSRRCLSSSLRPGHSLSVSLSVCKIERERAREGGVQAQLCRHGASPPGCADGKGDAADEQNSCLALLGAAANRVHGAKNPIPPPDSTLFTQWRKLHPNHVIPGITRG